MRYSSVCTLVSLIAFLSVMLTYCQVITKNERCPTKCGNVTIPYPFGIGNDCAFNQNFIIYCNQTKNPPTLSLKAKGSLPILDISVDGYLRKYTFVARDCYNQTGGDRHYSNPSSSLPSMFFYSSAQNKFTAIGCDTRSEVDGRTRGGEHDGGTRSGGSFALGCISYCISSSTVSNGSCSGIGCCQTGVPSGLSRFLVSLGSYKKHTLVHDFNPCSYGFIADKDYFNFTTASLLKMPNVVPTVVDWVIDNVNCATARRNASTYACKNRHSECSDYQNGLGYRCSCSSGYAGNPYLPDGCDGKFIFSFIYINLLFQTRILQKEIVSSWGTTTRSYNEPWYVKGDDNKFFQNGLFVPLLEKFLVNKQAKKSRLAVINLRNRI